MSNPSFVDFTDINGDTIGVNALGPIAFVRKHAGSTTQSEIVMEGGASIIVVASVAAVRSALGQALLGPGTLTNIPLGPVALASIGTDAVSVAGTLYYSEGYNPTTRTVTNVACLNGTTGVGTDLQIFALWNSSGALLGTTALAGTTPATADVFQAIALITPVELPPGRYFAGFQINGTTSPHQTIAAATYPNRTGSAAGVFATIGAITPPTSFTANVGPIHQLT